MQVNSLPTTRHITATDALPASGALAAPPMKPAPTVALGGRYVKATRK